MSSRYSPPGALNCWTTRKSIEQFIDLERRTSQSGKDSISHAKGAHDDSANAAAGALTLAGGNYDTMLTHPTDFLKKHRQRQEAR